MPGDGLINSSPEQYAAAAYGFGHCKPVLGESSTLRDSRRSACRCRFRLDFFVNGDPDFPDLNWLFTGNRGSGVVWVLAPDSFLPLDNSGCQLFFIVGGQRIQRRSEAGMG